jgi:hypothetical protein
MMLSAAGGHRRPESVSNREQLMQMSHIVWFPLHFIKRAWSMKLALKTFRNVESEAILSACLRKNQKQKHNKQQEHNQTS